MKKALLSLMPVVLFACGPGAKLDGKQGAAEALFLMSQPTAEKTGASGGSSGNGSIGASWNCPHGGDASLKASSLNINIGGGSSVDLDANLKLTYSECGLSKDDLGIAIFDGAIDFTQSVTTGESLVSVSQHFKGEVKLSGAYDDFVNADVTQRVAVGDLSADGKSVSVELIGTITTSDGTFEFNESLNVTAGRLSARVDSK